MYVTSLPLTYTYVHMYVHTRQRESCSSYSSSHGRVGPGICIYPAKRHVQARCSKNKQLASANHRASGPEANRIHGFTTDKAPIRQPAVCIVEKAGTVYHTAHIKGNYAGDSSCVRVFVASTATVETKISKTHP